MNYEKLHTPPYGKILAKIWKEWHIQAMYNKSPSVTTFLLVFLVYYTVGTAITNRKKSYTRRVLYGHL